MAPRTARLGLLASVLLVAGCVTEETPRVAEVRISANSQTVQPGGVITLSAEAFDRQGNPINGMTVAWTSRAPGIATVGLLNGLVTGLVPGAAEIAATVGSITGVMLITVSYRLPLVQSVRIEPGSAELRTGLARQFTATPLDSEGSPIPGRFPQWQSAAPDVATVSPSGLVTALKPGQVVIYARIEDQTGVSVVAVLPRVASVEVIGRAELDQVADTVQLNAIVRDADGAVLPGWPVTWSSSDPAVVRVSSSGKIASVDVGTAVIMATSELSNATFLVTVTRFAVAQVTIAPGISSLVRNRSITLQTVPLTAAGLRVRRPTTWSSGSPAVATVDGDGVVSALATGPALINAVVEGLPAQLHFQVVENSAPSLSLGIWHSCSVSGSEQVSCWGHRPSSGAGQDTCLDVTYYDTPFACSKSPTALVGGSHLVSVAAGAWHSCGLTPAGAAWCRGSNWAGELGVPPGNPVEVPVAVSGGHSFVSLAGGDGFTCGLKGSGDAWCWGRNSHGQLGNGSLVLTFSPGQVAGGHQFAQLTAGESHACGLTQLAKVYCWGSNSWGQLGDGTQFNSSFPSAVVTSQTFTEIEAGSYHTCALTLEGTAYCWGNGLDGAIGDGSGVSRSTPFAVSGGHEWSRISAASFYTCGTRIDGAGFCWGQNWTGALGNGTTTTRLIPTAVAGSVSFVEIVAGGRHACGRAVAGSVYCWGLGMTGALGLGNNVASQLSPSKVVGNP